MATDYPLDLLSEDGSTIRYQLVADFTDPDNQPAQGGALEPPIIVPSTGTTTIVEQDPPGEPVQSWDADTSYMVFGGSGVDGSGLGPTIPYVTVQSGAPTTYQTPLVFDSTAVTGGLYAWDGAQYQQVGGPLA